MGLKNTRAAVFAFLALLVGLDSGAQTQASDYKRFSYLKASIREQWAKQAQATIPLHFVGGLRCTAVYVGANGEALTNLHCLEKCITELGLAKEAPLVPGYTRVGIQNASAVRCQVKFGEGMQAGELKLLHVFGPGWVKEREIFHELMAGEPELFLRILERGYEASGDLALVKLPVETSTCVKLKAGSVKTVEGDQYAFNLAFPILFRKINPIESIVALGTKMFASHGRVSGDKEFVVEALKGQPLSTIPEMLLPRGVVMSSVDSESGSSGSPLFDENGELIGIVRATWKGNTFDYRAWTTQAIGVDEVSPTLKRLVPGNLECGN